MTLRTWLASPRMRRRAGWTAAVVASAGAVAVGSVAVQRAAPHQEPERFEAAPAVIPARLQQRRLTARDRAEIGATLDRFIPAAVERQNPAAAYELSTANLRGGSSRAEWRRGDVPVYPFETPRSRFHDWLLNYATRDEVSLELMPPARSGAELGGISFTVGLRRAGRRWLVDSFTPAATFAPADAPAKVRAQPDFGPGDGGAAAREAGGRLDRSGRGRVSAAWLVVPFAVLGAVILIGVGVLSAGAWQARRARAARPA